MPTTADTPTAPITAKRRFFRPRFTLAALLILVTVISPPLAYVAQRRAWNLKRKEAFDALMANGIWLELANPKMVPSQDFLNRTWGWLALDDTVPQAISASDEVMPPSQERVTESLKQLGYFPELESLELSEWDELTDEHLRFLAGMPRLLKFSLTDSPQVRGEFLKGMAAAKRIESFDLRNLNAMEAGPLSTLEKLTSLKGVCICGCPLLTDSSLQGVNLPAGVVDLRLEGNFGDVTLTRWLENCRLTYLKIDCPISSKTIAVLDSQQNLKWLDLANAPLEDKDFAFLKQCNQLNSLRLRSMPIQGAFLAWIPNPAELSELALSSTLLSDSQLPELARFTNLSEIDLSLTPLTGDGFGALNGRFNGVVIRLWGTRLSAEGKAAFAASICGTKKSRIWLPSNWRSADMSLLAHAPKSLRQCVVSKLVRREPNVPATFGATYSPNEMLDAKLHAPIDRCPTELMVPVKRLMDAAVRDADWLRDKENGSEAEIPREYEGHQKEEADGK